MNLNTIQKAGGVSIILGAVLLMLWTICWLTLLPTHGKDADLIVLSPNWIWITSLALPGVICMIFGFTAVYSRIYNKVGVYGLIGYVFLLLSYMHQGAQVCMEIFIYPILATNSAELLRDRILYNHPLFSAFNSFFYIGMLVGLILFCIALFKSKVFPKSGAILLFSGVVIYGVGPAISVYIGIAGVVILSLGCFILGSTLIKKSI